VTAAIVCLGKDYSTAAVKHTNVISRQARLSWWFIFKKAKSDHFGNRATRVHSGFKSIIYVCIWLVCLTTERSSMSSAIKGQL